MKEQIKEETEKIKEKLNIYSPLNTASINVAYGEAEEKN